MKRKSASGSGFYNLRTSIALFASLSGLSLALFTMATPSNRTADGGFNVGASTFARVTPNGITIENFATSERESTVRTIPGRPTLEPFGNTLWQVDDPNAIADGVSIDANEVWGAWTLQGARLSAYPILGNGTPDFEFSSFGSGNSGVASAKGADRMAFMESNAAGNDFRIHGFKSTSGGVPEWSFPFPVSDPNLPASSRKVAVSYDGSTVAAVVSDSVTQNSTLYVFEADTGEIRSTWTDPLRMNAVDLTDDGSVALVTQDNLAVLADTSDGSMLFSVAGSGAGNIFYRISGDRKSVV